MPDFQGTKRYKIQPNTENMPLIVKFPVATSVDADGAIPYGNQILSAEVKAYDPNGIEVSSSLISLVTVTPPDTVKVFLSYFSGATPGKYKLTFILHFKYDAYSDEFDLERRVWLTDT